MNNVSKINKTNLSQTPAKARFCSKCDATFDAAVPTRLGRTVVAPGDTSAAPTYMAPQPPTQAAPQPIPPQHIHSTAHMRPHQEPPKNNRILPILGILGGGILCLMVSAGLTFFLLDYLSGSQLTATPLAQAATATPTLLAAPASETPIPPTAPPDAPPTRASPPTQAPPTLPPGREVSYANTTFTYDPALAQNVNVQTVPESNYADAPYFDLYPEHSRFEFIGYPLFPDAFHNPQMMVYPTAAYASINPEAGNTITRLQNLLQSRPQAPPPDGLPFLPIWNAAQMMRAQMRYLDFQNGSGVRFLSQYGQSYWPINSQDMFYTFQGLTADGAYYIAAIFPASNPILPDPNSVTMDDSFYNNYETYVKDIENQLNIQPDTSFTPNLALLDNFIQSLSIK